MSIAKPFTLVANTYAKSSEVNANFDTVYSQVNSNISAISQNAVDIENIENNKADINGSSSQRFGVADAITDSDAINKRSLRNAIGNSIDYISGFTITKDSGSPEDTIIVSAGSAYDSTKSIVLSLANSLSKQNTNQAADATYYVYVISNSTGSSVDISISTESITPSLPSGYALYRKIGYYTTDSDNNISMINYYGHDSTAPQGISTVVETYVNGSSWYRVYSDGWCEQGGYANAGTTVTFLKPFKDTNYTLALGVTSTYGNWIQAVGFAWYSKTEKSFVSGAGQYGCGKDWLACGYIS